MSRRTAIIHVTKDMGDEESFEYVVESALNEYMKSVKNYDWNALSKMAMGPDRYPGHAQESMILDDGTHVMVSVFEEK